MTIYQNPNDPFLVQLKDWFINNPISIEELKNGYDGICVSHFSMGSIAWTGQKHTRQTKHRMSEAQKNVPKSEKHKRALSDAARKRYLDPSNHPAYGKVGKDNPNFGKHYGKAKTAECPYCKKMVAINNIKRYHYENCRWR